MSLVKVLVERVQVDSVRSRTYGENPDPVYHQKIWIFNPGSKFPVEFEIRLPEQVKFYQEGDYVMDLQANIKPGQYGDISFVAFSRTKLMPVTPDFLSSFDKVNQQIYDQLKKAA